MIGTVRSMAVGTALPYRCMFKKERASLFRVTLIAGFVNAGGLQQGRGHAAVRSVAVCAIDIAFRERHVGAPVKLRALGLMTSKTGLVDTLSG